MAYQERTHIPGPVLGASIKSPVKVSASKTSGSLTSVLNPERTAVIATLAYVHIKVGSSAACTVDVGTAATDVTSDNQIDGISVNAAANTVYDNITDKGSNGTTRQYVAAGGYFTAYVASGDANGLQADFYWDYQLLQGGSVNR